MPTTDIRSFAWLLRQMIDSTTVRRFLDKYKVQPNISLSEGYGEIECYQHGFDILLSNDERLALSGELKKTPTWRVRSLRFFSPRYCVGKTLTPYKGNLLSGLTFPLAEKDVRSKLGKPSKSSRKANCYDEYHYEDCSVRFVYPTAQEEVVFATLELPASNRPQYGLADPISPEERLRQLAGHRKKNWKIRLRAYEAVFGPAKQVFPGDKWNIDILVFHETADYITLVTSGMSDNRMYMPNNTREAPRAELEMYVSTIQTEVVDRLLCAAAFPFVEKTYLGHGDTIDWMTPIVHDSELTADLIIYSILEKHRELSLTIDDDQVQLLWCVPISITELEFKKEHGIDALLALFDEVNHPLVLDERREPYV